MAQKLEEGDSRFLELQENAGCCIQINQQLRHTLLHCATRWRQKMANLSGSPSRTERRRGTKFSDLSAMSVF